MALCFIFPKTPCFSLRLFSTVPSSTPQAISEPFKRDVPKYPGHHVGLLVAYQGTNYSGLQLNTSAKSIFLFFFNLS